MNNLVVTKLEWNFYFFSTSAMKFLTKVEIKEEHESENLNTSIYAKAGGKGVTFCDFFIKNFDLIWQRHIWNRWNARRNWKFTQGGAAVSSRNDSRHYNDVTIYMTSDLLWRQGSLLFYLHVTFPRIFFAHQEHAFPGRHRHLMSLKVSKIFKTLKL